jgi:hypothetical protein
VEVLTSSGWRGRILAGIGDGGGERGARQRSAAARWMSERREVDLAEDARSSGGQRGDDAGGGRGQQVAPTEPGGG